MTDERLAQLRREAANTHVAELPAEWVGECVDEIDRLRAINAPTRAYNAGGGPHSAYHHVTAGAGMGRLYCGITADEAVAAYLVAESNWSRDDVQIKTWEAGPGEVAWVYDARGPCGGRDG